MKKIILTLTLILLVGCGIFMIFNFSMQPAAVSNANSQALTQLLIPMDYPNRDQAIRQLNNLLRDAAHVFEYFLVSLILLIGLNCTRLKKILLYLLGLVLIFCVAFIDENIQIPVAGRAFEWIDIGKDMLGYTLASLICIFFTLVSRCFGTLRRKK